MLSHSSAAFVIAVLFVVFPVSSGAATIISTDGQGNAGYGILYGSQVDEAGWSQTSTYSGVTITAEIDPGTAPGTSGTAFLMTQIGPGTTSAEQIATASFSATGAANSPVLNTLFSGLTLGPGDYDLVLGPSLGLGWETATAGITPVTAPGVAFVSDDYGTSAGYPPASSFSSKLGNDLEFTVSGTAVPEPATLALLGSALLGLGMIHLRGRGAKV
jgi:hypothetical protein